LNLRLIVFTYSKTKCIIMPNIYPANGKVPVLIIDDSRINDCIIVDVSKNTAYQCGMVLQCNDKDLVPFIIDLPPGDWQPLGWSDELTRRQKEIICDVVFPMNLNEDLDEELYSLLRSSGAWTENPIPHPADIKPTSRWHYDKLKADWQAAESKAQPRVFILPQVKS